MKKWCLALIITVVASLLGCGNKSSLVSIDIHPTNPKISFGSNQKLSATGIYSDGTQQDLTTSVTWSSSNTSIATISNVAGSIGKATAVALGSTTIMAISVDGVSSSTTLTVVPIGAASPLSLTGAASTLANGLYAPFGITTDGPNLYVTCGDNTIRKIVIATGVVTTLASGLPNPTGITTDGTNLYVANIYNTISKIAISTGIVTQLADGLSFNGPSGITTDGLNLYAGGNISGTTINKILISTGVVSSLASNLSFNQPAGAGIITDGTNLYVTNESMINKIIIGTGVVTPVASGLSSPVSVTTDGTNLYVTNYTMISKIVIATGAVTTLTNALDMPAGITTDGTYLYVASGDGTIKKIQ